ncbi:MAG: hypothetical protein HQL68_12900, partial [Magnetococcales bacterium]|nr:hypothetical protein [Magnetococcales bacterium]
LRYQRSDFLEGSRLIYPLNRAAMPFTNQFGNSVFAIWFSWFLGQYSTDVLSGIKAIRRQDYQLIYDNWGFLGMEDPFGDFELLFGAARLGLKINEIPIRYQPRSYGESKTNVLKHGLLLLKMALHGHVIFRTMTPRKKTS